MKKLLNRLLPCVVIRSFISQIVRDIFVEEWKAGQKRNVLTWMFYGKPPKSKRKTTTMF